MTISEQYRRQVALLVQSLPFVAEEKCFALKGGTAINLFVRDLPRLSVDIDLTYLPVDERTKSFAEINDSLVRIGKQIGAGMPGSRVHESILHREGIVSKLVVTRDNAQIKIETSPVTRGCVFDPEVRSVTSRVEDEFGFAEIQTVSFADLYAGKIVAALDRQHPRDLFDVRDLLANEGIDEQLRSAFIIYLISCTRPLTEVLAPNRNDISQEFARGFDGMSSETVTIDELNEAREQLIEEVVGKMPETHREFLISFEHMEPDWFLLDIPGMEKLPAVRWRLQNLAKVSKDKRATLIENLKTVLRDGKR